MQIVTDRGSDLCAEQLEGIQVSYAPLRMALDGKTYSSGEDISAAQFYDLLEGTGSFPSTSQPSPGEVAEILRRLAQVDPEILFIHISSGLSGTYNAAKTAAEMVPEAHVTFWDTKTLSCPEGWQVEAAARALQAGWTLERVLERLSEIRRSCEGLFTLETLKYLIHGGRISHLKGLLGSVLHIHPVIGVEKDSGKYYTLAQERTMKRALHKIADSVSALMRADQPLRIQLLHGKNPVALDTLREIISARFDCYWTPEVRVAPILGAHTGGSLIGLAAGPAALFADIPGVAMAKEAHFDKVSAGR